MLSRGRQSVQQVMKSEIKTLTLTVTCRMVQCGAGFFDVVKTTQLSN